MHCGACGAAVTMGARFCVVCGAPVPAGCPQCGQPVLGDEQRFCGGCGLALVTPRGEAGSIQTDAVPPTTVTERRVCSVLFADLVGFTTLAEGRDPEDVRELLSRYFDLARTVIGRYGGLVEKFIGDAVMAVWGTPTATEHDAERAVRAGLELLTEVGELGAGLGATGLAARAGVVTGEVAVTIGAVAEGMVAGDAVNTAARIQGVSAPGTMLVDAASMRLASQAISFQPAGAFPLKGKAEPTELWHAVRVVSGRGGALRSDGLEAALTGRDHELRAVKDLFHAAAARRRARMVVVTGPAGVGKSRLGWELEKHADGLVDTILWHRGRCLSYGDGIAFWALAEIVRQRLGIGEEDPTEVAASKLAEGLARFVPDPAEREYVAARLGRLLGVEVASPDSVVPREELFAGWRLFFERLAEVAPVVLVVEDAHRLDTGLLDFLDHLIDWTRDSPIFVMVLARPDLDEARPRFGIGRNRSMLSLDPLDADSMDQLVAGLLPGMSPESRRAVVQRAEGIPLFAVETIRSLIDRGVVALGEDGYRLVGQVQDLAVPESLHALLAARLDALDPVARSLVADASVVGSTFPLAALVAVSGLPEEEVETALTDLVRRDVLEVSADRLSPGRAAYRFGQELLRQVAYDTLSRRARKSRHLSVATHLRAVFANDGEEVAEVVARHYLDAILAGPDDADVEVVRAEALSNLVRAGERAERAGAPRRAVSAYATAAGLVAGDHLPVDRDQLVHAAGLWERAARAAYTAGASAAIAEHAREAMRLYLAAGDRRAAARTQALTGRALRQSGRHAEARAEAAAALEVLRPDPDADTIDALLLLQALEIFSGGPDGDRLSAEAVALGQALDVDGALLARLFTGRGVVHSFANRTAQAAAYQREAARLAEGVGASAEASLALLNLSDVLASSEPSAAADAARRALEHARRIGHRDRLTLAVANLTAALLHLGQWDEAAAVLARAAGEEGAGDHPRIQLWTAWVAGLRGEASSVDAVLDAASGLVASESIQDRANVALLRAYAAAARDEPAAVLHHARLALRHEQALGIRHDTVRWGWPLAARAARALGDSHAVGELVAALDVHPTGHLPPILRAERELARAWAAAGGGERGAATDFEGAVASLRRVASPFHLAHGLLDRCAYLRSAGSVDTGPALEEARAIATRLACPPLHHRVDSLVEEAGLPPDRGLEVLASRRLER